LKLKTQVDVDAKTTLEKALINGKHVCVQVCNFKTFKELLPRPCYNKDHRKGMPKILGQRVPKSNVEPLPKRQHASISYDVSIMDVSQEEPKFADQMTNETQLTNQNTTTSIGSNIGETITQVLNSLTIHNNGIIKLTLILKAITSTKTC
jgi:hypothetical protein